ncbi:MAG: metallophosphatase [Chloroflexota bacterium]|jgi:2',3'-cyclic-nucleotide 2'-phosphodiesterase (5'-nucleotidase family)
MRSLRLSLLGTVILALLGWSGGAALAQADDVLEPSATVTFYHTADLHESGERLPQIAGFVESCKDDDPNVLFVDSGDWFNKGDLTPLNTRGEAMTAMLGASAYDAMTLGNHEHSFGTERLAELIDRFALPVLAANVDWPEGMEPEHAEPYRLFDLDGVTVAIIGTAASCDAGSTSRCGDDLLEVLPIEESIGDLVTTLEERADIVVLLTHQGSWQDKQLAQAVPGVDIIFGGHSHETFRSLVIADGTDTIIQHSGAGGYSIGELTVGWDGERIVEPELRLVLVTEELPGSDAVEEIRQEYLSRSQ